MKKSVERTLTTHVGSLPRSAVLLRLLDALEKRQPIEKADFQREVDSSLAAIVREQAAAGVDVAGDGELPRIGFSMYVKDRMSGFGGTARRGTVTDFAKFPEYAALMSRRMNMSASDSASVVPTPECVDRVRYDPGLVRATEELDSFAQALRIEARAAAKFADTFVTAASPGIISTTLLRNGAHPHYASDS